MQHHKNKTFLTLLNRSLQQSAKRPHCSLRSQQHFPQHIVRIMDATGAKSIKPASSLACFASSIDATVPIL